MWRPIYHEFLRWAKISRRVAEGYKRTEITVETDQILVIRKSGPARAWCAECGREVDVLMPDHAGALSVRDLQPKLGHDTTSARAAAGEIVSTDRSPWLTKLWRRKSSS
jgi:hypothetical protein